METDPVGKSLRFYLSVQHAYVEMTRKYFESNAPLTPQAKAYVELYLLLVEQAKDSYYGALTDAGLPVPGADESDVSPVELDPEMEATVERMADESAAAFHSLVTSILEQEEGLLDRSIDTLLKEGTVTINKPQGVVWATVTDPGTEDALITGEYRSFNGGRGNSLVRLSLIPASDLRPTLRRHLAAWIANVVKTDESEGDG